MPNFFEGGDGIRWPQEHNFSFGAAVVSTEGLLQRITAQSWYCPHCSHQLNLKTTKDGTRNFWGCTDYPTCHFSCSELDVTRYGLSAQENSANTPHVQIKRRHGSIVHSRRSTQKRHLDVATPESQRIILPADRETSQEHDGSEIHLMKEQIRLMQSRIERLEKEQARIEERRKAAGFEIE